MTNKRRTVDLIAQIKIIGLITLAVIIIVGLSVGGWYAYWAVHAANVDRNYKVNTSSQQYQSGLVSREQDDIAGWHAAADPAQKAYLKTTICTNFVDLTVPPADIVHAYTEIC